MSVRFGVVVGRWLVIVIIRGTRYYAHFMLRGDDWVRFELLFHTVSSFESRK